MKEEKSLQEQVVQLLNSENEYIYRGQNPNSYQHVVFEHAETKKTVNIDVTQIKQYALEVGKPYHMEFIVKDNILMLSDLECDILDGNIPAIVKKIVKGNKNDILCHCVLDDPRLNSCKKILYYIPITKFVGQEIEEKVLLHFEKGSVMYFTNLPNHYVSGIAHYYTYDKNGNVQHLISEQVTIAKNAEIEVNTPIFRQSIRNGYPAFSHVKNLVMVLTNIFPNFGNVTTYIPKNDKYFLSTVSEAVAERLANVSEKNIKNGNAIEENVAKEVSDTDVAEENTTEVPDMEILVSVVKKQADVAAEIEILEQEQPIEIPEKEQKASRKGKKAK